MFYVADEPSSGILRVEALALWCGAHFLSGGEPSTGSLHVEALVLRCTVLYAPDELLEPSTGIPRGAKFSIPPMNPLPGYTGIVHVLQNRR